MEVKVSVADNVAGTISYLFRMTEGNNINENIWTADSRAILTPGNSIKTIR
jgi:hypothetical protein